VSADHDCPAEHDGLKCDLPFGHEGDHLFRVSSMATMPEGPYLIPVLQELTRTVQNLTLEVRRNITMEQSPAELAKLAEQERYDRDLDAAAYWMAQFCSMEPGHHGPHQFRRQPMADTCGEPRCQRSVEHPSGHKGRCCLEAGHAGKCQLAVEQAQAAPTPAPSPVADAARMVALQALTVADRILQGLSTALLENKAESEAASDWLADAEDAIEIARKADVLVDQVETRQS
jgi:hypothetical protein